MQARQGTAGQGQGKADEPPSVHIGTRQGTRQGPAPSRGKEEKGTTKSAVARRSPRELCDFSSRPRARHAATMADVTPATAIDQWEASVASIREGTRLYLTNDFAAAEALFKLGMGTEAASLATDQVKQDEEDEEPPPTVDSIEARDVRGAFALQFAVVGLMRGVASLANDQLDECLTRLWEADRLASLDTPWVGKKVTRGVCTLVAGVVQCLQQNLVRGVYNIVRSWQWIRYLRSEALEYQGVGASVVRSAAQLALGVFSLTLSLLPPHLIAAASWSTGFEIDREAGLALLRTCQEEEGIYSPIAALALLTFELDTKVFLGEAQSVDELAACERIIEWASTRFQDSVFFSLCSGELHACRHDLDGARAVVGAISNLPCVSELKALNAVVAYKRAVYHLASLDWHKAGIAFAASLEVYRAAGRRSLSPAMAVFSALCRLVSGEEEEARAMMEVVDGYRALEKKNWQRQDRLAFRLLAQFRGEQEPAAAALPSVGAGGGGTAAAAAAAAAASAAASSAAAAARGWASWATLAAASAGPSLAGDSKCGGGAGGGGGGGANGGGGSGDSGSGGGGSNGGCRPPPNVRSWALLELSVVMTVAMRCSWWMGETQCDGFIALLKSLELVTADDRAQRAMILAQFHSHRRQPHESLKHCAEGLQLEGQLDPASASTVQWGVAPMMHCISAQQHAALDAPHKAEASLQALSGYANYTAQGMVSFKTTRLRRALGLMVQQSFEQLALPAGYKATLLLRMEQGAAATVSWDWALESRDVDFSAAFQPDGGGAQVTIAAQTRHVVADGPGEGKFVLPEGCSAGSLTLEWSNCHSYLRAKSVAYRMVLSNGEEPPKPVIS